MSHGDEVRLFRRRSSSMLRHARECMRSGDYDLAAFLAEQSAQLFLKSVILELTGEIPRTHSIRQLLYIIKLVDERKAGEIDEFTHEHRRMLVGLEDAYIASRYLFRVYGKEEVEDLVKVAEKVIELVGNNKIEA